MDASESLQRQLAEDRENLRLIEERKAEYVLDVDVPLQLIREERRLRKRIAELERELDRTQGTGLTKREQRALRYRTAILRRVYKFWVQGVLDQSLHGAVRLELGLEERIDLLGHPWDTLVQMPDRPAHPIRGGTPIISLFDAMDQTLLILGAPGSGKTTMLLELASQAIQRAERDLQQPIPVVFLLSAWTDVRQPFADWLADELHARYYVPIDVARHWIENDQLLLLLDGLDEVAAGRREACVRSINAHLQEHVVPIAVCSRTTDWEALTTRLLFHGAVRLQPLTPQQVEDYLDGAGIELLAVRRTLQHDPTLQEMTRSPLMLSVMTFAYRGMSVHDLRPLDSVEARRQHVFDAYLRRAFERRRMENRYTPHQVVRWLTWLARGMSQRSQAVFYIEQLQPDWLPTRLGRLCYALGVRLIIGLALMLNCALVYALAGSVDTAPTVGLIVGLAVISASTLAIWMPAWLAIALSAGVTFVLARACFEWNGALIAALIFGLQAGLAGVSVDRVRVVEKLSWSWKKVAGVWGIMIGLALLLGLGAEQVLGWEPEEVAPMPAVLLPMGLAFILALRWSRSEAIEITTVPNQGFWWSARNAVQVGLIALAASVAIGVPIGAWGGSPEKLVALELLLGLFVALPVALSVGGTACIQHLMLRFLLHCGNYLPWKLVPMLDCAAERILMHRVGGGYKFIHRLLLDHFAGQETWKGGRG